MKDVYIHVGLPKTGTSYLQEQYFPHMEGLHYVRRDEQVRLPSRDIVDRLWFIAEANPLFVDLGEQQEAIDELLRDIPDERVLISLERLVGGAFSSFRDHIHLTQVLRRIFPSGRIILVIRKQDDLLDSLYRQFLRRYHDPTVDGFINHIDGRLVDRARPVSYPGIQVAHLNYHAFARNYVEVFGKERVLVLPYELLKNDRTRFLDTLCDFVGVDRYHPEVNNDVNPSYSALSCHVAQVLNRFVRHSGHEKRLYQFIPHEPFTPYLARRSTNGLVHRALASLNRRLSLRFVLENGVDRLAPKKGTVISERKRQLIMATHRDSNRALDEAMDLDLKRYGYY